MLILHCLEYGHSPFPEVENNYELLEKQANAGNISKGI